MNSEEFALWIEKIFFPSNILLVLGLSLIAYLGANLINNLIAFVTSFLAYGIVVKLVKMKYKRGFIIYSTGAFSGLVTFFIMMNLFSISKELVLAALSAFVITLIVYLVRPTWKISGHLSGITTLSTILSIVDVRFALLYLTLPLVIYSRLKLKRHTIVQIIAGIIIGMVVPLVVFKYVSIFIS